MFKNRLAQVLSPMGAIRVFRKHWQGSIVIAALGCLIAVLIVRSLPAMYRAETVVLVESQKIPEKLVSSTVNAELQDRLATISQEVLSATRLQTVIDKFNLYAEDRKRLTREEIIDQMRKDVNIKLERGWTRNQPGAFRISLLGKNPEQIAAVVNQLGSFFIEENLRTREIQAEGTSEFIDAQLADAKKVLTDLESKVAAYKLQHSGELPEQQPSLMAAINSLQVQLQGNQDATLRVQQSLTLLEGSLSAAEATRSAIQQALQPSSSPAAGGGTIITANGTQVRQPLTELEAARKQLEDFKLRYTEKFPEVRTMQALVARLEAVEKAKEAPADNMGKGNAEAVTVAREVAVSPALTQSLLQEAERITTIRSQIDSAKQELKTRQADHDRIVNALASYQRRAESLPLREQDMAGLKRDYDISRSNYESLLKKSLEADMASDMEKRQKAERFTVLDTARIPEKPTKPNRPLLYAVGAVLSLVFGLMFGVVRELKANVILGEWDLPGNVVVLGRVPKIAPNLAQATPGPVAPA